jgi:hypothetical protein
MTNTSLLLLVGSGARQSAQNPARPQVRLKSLGVTVIQMKSDAGQPRKESASLLVGSWTILVKSHSQPYSRFSRHKWWHPSAAAATKRPSLKTWLKKS